MSSTDYLASCLGPMHGIEETLDPNPSAPVPFGGRPAAAPSPITRPVTTPLSGRKLVDFLAPRLGKSKNAVQEMLRRGLIPGVQKLDPTKDRSHHFAPDPEDCVRRYFAGERGEKRAA